MKAEELIKNQDILFAHKDDNGIKKPEKLTEHLERTFYFYGKLCEHKHIDEVVDNIISNLTYDGECLNEKCRKFVKELFENAVYLHDMGKINPAFQFKRMGNKLVDYDEDKDGEDYKHSGLSALIYAYLHMDSIDHLKVDDEDMLGFIRHILYSFAYVISRHHTYLEDLNKVDFYESLNRMLQTVKEQKSYLRYFSEADLLINDFNLKKFNSSFRFCNGSDDSPYELYILTKLLYSTIVSCDYYATYLYDTGNEPQFNYIEDVSSALSTYRSGKIYQGIKAFDKDESYFDDSPINKLRSRMFLDAEKNLLCADGGKLNVNKYNIFYLEAPTGSGKTNTSINLALNIINNTENMNKIFYVFPFNTLVEQTKKSLDGFFNKDFQKDFKVAVINSITPIITSEENSEKEMDINFKADWLNRQMLHYPVTLTTHVNFFNYLFGEGREINLPLVHLCNSVIILDEIQSYRNEIWNEIITMMDVYAKYLNMKIIIMSATLPKLDKLIKKSKSHFCELITNKSKYYHNPLFRDRVKLNFDLLGLNKENVREGLLSKIDDVLDERKHTRLLIEFIKKSTAREFYNLLRETYPDRRIVEITGDDSNYCREIILNEICEKKDGKFLCKDIIVVATQVIEAGVDIDMDVGFKDISLLDGEEQFLGRINRSCMRKDCFAYFFNLDEADKVYRNDFRLECDLMNESYRKYLSDKNFKEFYEKCFIRLNAKKAKNNTDSFTYFEDNVRMLNFKEVNEKLQLIQQENHQLFLSHKLTVSINGEIEEIDGDELWNSYVEKYKDNDTDYAKKQIELSRLAQKMAYFTYNYFDYSNKHGGKPSRYDDRMGNLYFISNGEDYMIKDEETGLMKFDRTQYEKSWKGLTL